MNGSRALRRLPALAACLLMAGCAGNAYLDAKRNVAPGGQQERDISQANNQLAAAQAQNVALQSAKQQRDAEIERNDQRIRSLQADLKKQEATLAAAVKANKVTQARADQMKRDLAALKADTESADLQNQSARMDKNPNPTADAAKEAKLKELEKRKKDLEAALAAMSTAK